MAAYMGLVLGRDCALNLAYLGQPIRQNQTTGKLDGVCQWGRHIAMYADLKRAVYELQMVLAGGQLCMKVKNSEASHEPAIYEQL